MRACRPACFPTGSLVVHHNARNARQACQHCMLFDFPLVACRCATWSRVFCACVQVSPLASVAHEWMRRKQCMCRRRPRGAGGSKKRRAAGYSSLETVASLLSWAPVELGAEDTTCVYTLHASYPCMLYAKIPMVLMQRLAQLRPHRQ